MTESEVSEALAEALRLVKQEIARLDEYLAKYAPKESSALQEELPVENKIKFREFL